MTVDSKPELRTGYWYNHDGGFINSLQWTTTQYWSIVVGLVLALLLAWASPWVMKIVQHFLLQLALWWHQPQPPLSEEETLLKGGFKRDGLSRERAPVSYWPAFFITGLSILLATSFQLAGRFTADGAVHSSGLVKSDNCGMWVLDKQASNNDQYERDVEYQIDKERRAAEYARLCYRGTSTANPEACSFFVEKSISYTTQGADCPFSNGLCAGGLSGAITFDTGLVPASKLGLNVERSPMMRRKTTCAPLNMSHNYVEELRQPDGWQYRYKYGDVHYKSDSGDLVHQNYTFLMPGDPFLWDVGTYSVWIYEFVQRESEHYWNPIPELAPPADSYLALMFIASCHILYRDTWTNDYIFPRPELEIVYPGLYVNPDPRAHPLACVDEVRVCTHNDERSCSPIHPASDSNNGYGYEFIRLALKRSKTYDSIQFRMGTALLAQESVGQFRSRPLCGPFNDNCQYTQWVLEAQALFETSLARLQFDALDVAMGLHSDEGKPYREDTAKFARDGNLCNKYKVRLPKGYENVNLLTTGLYILLILLLGILQLDSGCAFPDEKQDDFFESNMIGIEWVCYRLTCCCRSKQTPHSSAGTSSNNMVRQTSSERQTTPTTSRAIGSADHVEAHLDNASIPQSSTSSASTSPTISPPMQRFTCRRDDHRNAAETWSEPVSTSRPHVRIDSHHRDDASDVAGAQRTNTWVQAR